VTDETQQSFEELKKALLDVDTLAYPTPGIPCILDTDASDVAVGAVLSQMIDGVEKPIAYLSRVLNGTQSNYCPTRRELLAVITSLQHFRHYLLGNKVILRTDHHSLKWLRTFKRPEGILARWIETLAEFDFEIEHRAGRLHSNADDKTKLQSAGEKSPPTIGLTNAKERISSSSHCLYTRFSCAPSSQTMPSPSCKQKIPRLEKPTK